MALRSGVAIDLGTVNSLVYVLGRGIVLEEPSVIALHRGSGRVAAVGEPADRLAGREPAEIQVVHPVRDGVVSDLDAATSMLRTYLHRVRFHTSALRPRAVMCVPSGATALERHALVTSVAIGHPRLDVRLLDEPVAAAVGVGTPTGSNGTLFVVDVGGGTTEAAVVVDAKMVAYRSLRLGGNAMDDAIQLAVRRGLGVRISHHDAERLKIELGLSSPDRAAAEVAGIDAVTGALREVVVDADLVSQALERPVLAIAEAVADLVSAMPPDVAKDVVNRGVQLVGGGALLSGIAGRIAKEAGVGVAVPDDPLRAVVRGAAHLLEESFDTLAQSA